MNTPTPSDRGLAEFAEFADHSAPTAPPPADTLHFELPAGTSFDEGCVLLEEAVKQDELQHRWIRLTMSGTTGAVLTSRDFLRDNYGMSVPMAGGLAQHLDTPGEDGENPEHVSAIVYRCPVTGCGQERVTVYGDAPLCPVHQGEMAEAGRIR
ncbi:hypothetical protein [Streptomyces sp. NBC_00690]|uniref:hypothetical protein n=1 Tax=Streptomyces sp. NBC_00690 TaxID=2975808 RepID=UPI002E2A43C0|nr:hypothetical protein [Streptomyces sp. NBC_00690]